MSTPVCLCNSISKGTSTIAEARSKFFNNASILHSILFRTTYEALKHHGFDRPPHSPLNSCYSRKLAWIIYPGDLLKTERDVAIALITLHHSSNPCASSFSAASTTQIGPSSVGITSLGPLSYDSPFILQPAIPTATVQARTSGTPTTSMLPVS